MKPWLKLTELQRELTAAQSTIFNLQHQLSSTNKKLIESEKNLQDQLLTHQPINQDSLLQAKQEEIDNLSSQLASLQ